jgi:type IV pilus assembly protein PilM
MADIVAGQDRRRQIGDDDLDFALGEDLICGHCGQENNSTRSFCGRCGHRLWETCPECGAAHRHGEKFCGKCGTDLEQLLNERRQRFESQLQEVQGLREQHEFGGAITRLKRLTRVEDVRLKPLAEQAELLLDEVSAEKEQWERSATQALQEAAGHLERRQYADVVTVLERVPECLRDEQVCRLLAEGRGKRDEISELTAGIQQALQAKLLHELPGKIERLLELQPGHPMATRLASQLRDRLLSAAKKKLAAFDYAAALKLFAQIPPSACSVEIEKLRDRARELDWLLEDLKLSPVANAPLLGLAERLVRLSPDDPQAQRLAEELRIRLQESPSDRRSAALSWATLRNYRYGFPVHALVGLQRIVCAPAAETELRRSPGRFFVACGLALQGLDQAAISINLLPSQDRGFFTRLRRKTASSAWGLELGTTGLKAAHLTYDRQRSTVTLDAVQTFEYRRSLTTVSDEAEQRQLKKEALIQFAARNKLEGERICYSVSGILTLGRFLEVPPVEPKRLEDTIRREADFQFPLDLNELAWGHQIFPLPNGASPEATPHRVVMQAVKQFHVANLLHLAEETGLRVDVVQSECLALHNLAVYEFFGGEQDGSAASQAVALLDVGADIANLVISSPSCVWFRSIGVGGETFTTQLLRPFKLVREQAELLKREPARARRVYQMYDLLDQDLTHLAEEVERSLTQFRRQIPGVTVRRMYGVGGGFHLHGLLRRLCRKR